MEEMRDIEALLTEERVFDPPEEFVLTIRPESVILSLRNGRWAE